MFDLLENWIRKSTIRIRRLKGLNEWKSISDELLTWCKSEAAEMYELCDGAAPDTMGDFGHMEFRHSKTKAEKTKESLGNIMLSLRSESTKILDFFSVLPKIK